MSQNVNHEAIATALKARIFDLTETAAALEAQLKDRDALLTEIIRLVDLKPNEDGTVQLQDIAEAVAALIPVAEEVEAEEE